MSFNYAGTAQTVQRLLTRFGALTTLTRQGAGTYDPSSGASSSTPTSVPVTAMVVPYGDRFIDNTTIYSTDLQAFLSAVGVAEPKAGDTLLWGGKQLMVIRAKNLGPSGVFVLYELQVRGQ